MSALPSRHAQSAATAKGTVLHAWSSRNKETPMYRNTNVSASVASVLKIIALSLLAAVDKLGRA